MAHLWNVKNKHEVTQGMSSEMGQAPSASHKAAGPRAAAHVASLEAEAPALSKSGTSCHFPAYQAACFCSWHELPSPAPGHWPSFLTQSLPGLPRQAPGSYFLRCPRSHCPLEPHS